MKTSTGADADSLTVKDANGTRDVTSADTVTVTTSAPPPTATSTPDVVAPAEDAINDDATSRGAPGSDAAAMAASCAAAWAT